MSPELYPLLYDTFGPIPPPSDLLASFINEDAVVVISTPPSLAGINMEKVPLLTASEVFGNTHPEV